MIRNFLNQYNERLFHDEWLHASSMMNQNFLIFVEIADMRNFFQLINVLMIPLTAKLERKEEEELGGWVWWLGVILRISWRIGIYFSGCVWEIGCCYTWWISYANSSMIVNVARTQSLIKIFINCFLRFSHIRLPSEIFWRNIDSWAEDLGGLTIPLASLYASIRINDFLLSAMFM